MDDVSAMLILAPLFLETLNRYGIDLVHFGIVMVLNIQMGMPFHPAFWSESVLWPRYQSTYCGLIARGVAPFLLDHAGLPDAGHLYPKWISLALPHWLLK